MITFLKAFNKVYESKNISKRIKKEDLYLTSQEELEILVNESLINKTFNSKVLSWRERISKLYGKDPLICPNCFNEMVLTSFHHKKYGDLYYP